MLGMLKRWWQERTGEEETPFDGDTPAWVASVAFHLAILVGLAIISLSSSRGTVELTVSSLTEEEEKPVIENFSFAKEDQPEIGANSLNGATEALALAPTIDVVSDAPTEIHQTEMPTVNVEVNLDIPTGPNLSQHLVVKGAAGVGTTGASGAIDRLTHEILLSLEERKTLVVWLFDQSGSLQQQRGDIQKRFHRIYEELGVIEASGNEAFKKHSDKPLLSAIMAFGDKVSFRTEKPTDDIDELTRAIAGIENDPSGVERVFTAVKMAVEKYQDYRHTAPRRNVMIVIASDEVGDDENRMEDTLAACRRHEMPVYVIGIPAIFGRETAVVKYVDPDPQFSQSVQWIPVRQGPETVRPERLQLAFSSKPERDLERIDSGFGPFALTRLCVETGGIYFSIHPNRNSASRFVSADQTAVMSAQINHFFDPAIMRRYRPDYLSLQEYDQMLMQNQARAALVRASMMSVGTMQDPQTSFPKRDEGDLKRLLDEAQKTAAKLEPKIEELYQVLKLGEKDRPKLTQPRWQAGYDLALGRVLAAKVRTESYNAMLAQLKGGRKFQNDGSDTWVLKPSDKITVGSATEKLGKQSRELLEKITKDHEGTPWALLAQRELETPLGWEWSEANTGVNRPREAMGNGNNNNNNPADALNRMMKPKPTRPNIKL